MKSTSPYRKYLITMPVFILALLSGCTTECTTTKHDKGIYENTNYFCVHYEQDNGVKGILELNGKHIFWSGTVLPEVNTTIPRTWQLKTTRSNNQILLNAELQKDMADEIWEVIKQAKLPKMHSYITSGSQGLPFNSYVYQPAEGKLTRVCFIIDKKKATQKERLHPYIENATTAEHMLIILQRKLLRHPKCVNLYNDIWNQRLNEKNE